MVSNRWLTEERSTSWNCFGCIHVRHATLALAIGYMVMHLLNMSLLIYVAVNLEQLSQANKSPAEGMAKPDVAYVQQVLEVDIGVPTRLDDGQGEQPVINIQVTNMSYWLTVFVIKSRDSSLPTRTELNVAMLYSALSLVIAVLAICSLSKSTAGCLVPFMISQLCELLFSVLVIAGVDLYGLAPKEDMMANSSVPKDQPITFAQLSWQMQAATVIGHVLTLSIKMYIVRIIWQCIQFMRYSNSRAIRQQRQDLWTDNLLKGTSVLGASAEDFVPGVPPPAYNHLEMVGQADYDEANQQRPPTGTSHPPLYAAQSRLGTI
ncbi:hypothetical protein RvY_18922 [Ramazzottius varieornatus]|uniref:Uncharacterized protein n=1 Tax=Ramazzottius varieornatus TaxID=947166 RepID=A0A1D1W7K5_RAMVA|nr:hypothetical protein RvY_18922 [Ramazzottius varieornatus]